MTASNTDSGTMELDKLIHSLEFENQQYVKMIEKENQLIISLESQIEEKMQLTVKLEQDISRFDEDTRRLHRLYTNNRDNIESLRNTINVLSDHETALSRQLEVIRGKTEESRKFYEAQLANYSSIRDDYMKKYTRFPLAIELEKKKQALVAAQRKFDDSKAVKLDLEGRVACKESELDCKIMTRIVVRIAKTQLATAQLRKEIDERLAEKSDLVEKLKEIRTTKHTGQDEQCTESHEDCGNTLSMEIDDVEHVEGSDRQNSSDEVEGFSNMSIIDGHRRSSNGDGQRYRPDSDTSELYMKDSEGNHYPGEISNTLQGKQLSGMNVGTVHSWSVRTHEDGGQMCTTNDPLLESQDINKPAASDHINMMEQVVAEQEPEDVRVTCAGEALRPSLVKVPKTHVPLPSTISQPPSIRIPSLQNLGKVSEKRMTSGPNAEMKKTPEDIIAGGGLTPSSGQAPKLFIPRLSGVPPPPPSVHIPPIQKQFKLPEHVKHPESCAEMKKVPPPSVSMLQDLRQKMSQLLPRPALHASNQQSQQTSLPKTPDLTSTTAEQVQVEKRPRSLQSSNTQLLQFQTAPSDSSTETLTSKQVSGQKTSQPTNQQKTSNEAKKETVEKQNTSVRGMVKMQTHTKEFSVSTSIKTADVEVPTKGCDSPPTEPDGCQNLFSVNFQGLNSTDISTQSPKGKYRKCTNRRSPSSEGSFLLESLFGNFEKKLNEDTYESDEEAAPTSIFSLFNISPNPGSGIGENSKDAGSFFTFGKFTENTGSPSTEEPNSLLNLFTKSQNSDCSQHEFAVNIQEDEKESETTSFKLGVAGEERSESDEEREKPLFNLF